MENYSEEFEYCGDTSKRPTSEEIYDIIGKWDIYDEDSEIYKIFKKADKEMKSNINDEISTNLPGAYDVSTRPLSDHINTAKLLSRDSREDDLVIEWAVNINEISEELETNDSNLE
ncbi:11886_t:CDS:2 [Diversispora eburnea]|uniref:11886_t:CDS:1 n=1 Tax=Diversispora eburnea TaxID=1213867 RepID=A0A9N8Z5G5_9GLOM|nr:11886_t:CDS:2 [Diversispora eburnea]